MSDRRTLGVLIGRAPPATVTEALRAAVGLTLRGDRVALAIVAEAMVAAGDDGARAVATLALFGHPTEVVAGARTSLAALDAAVVEVWGDAGAVALVGPPRRRLHLLRHGRRPPTEAEPVLHLPPSPADAHGATRSAPDRWDPVLDAILDADAVVVW